MVSAIESRVVVATDGFIAAARDAEQRHASLLRLLGRILCEITPSDLDSEEASILIGALEPAVTRKITNDANPAISRIPPVRQLRAMLDCLHPADLSATETIVVLTVLVPVHSRVVTARAAGRPISRLILECAQ